jgi:hypothetical protein
MCTPVLQLIMAQQTLIMSYQLIVYKFRTDYYPVTLSKIVSNCTYIFTIGIPHYNYYYAYTQSAHLTTIIIIVKAHCYGIDTMHGKPENKGGGYH